MEIINGLPLAIAVLDKNQRLVLVNKAARLFVNKEDSRLIGVVGGEALGCIHHKNAPEGCGYGKACLKCKLRATLQDTLEKRQGHHMVETTMVFQPHEQRHLRITTQPLVLRGDDVVLLSIEDVTGTKKHEQAILEKEKLSAVIQTAGAVCHEMNQPLMVILGFSELVMDELAEGNVRKSSILKIRDQAERMGGITRKLMKATQYKTKEYLNSEILDIGAASDKIEQLN
ncbi:histidine kinase dimerization/phospho-acceptor domain-containing protein [Desulfospira joergensenii]|uniref:histidine kinase dimerization/phospho-acceptor domain-containing protein n=1 Tax=Desulfospira joergensenii TaxID=53329 RepID=UPI001FCA176B|nr:histidine kinase dimerization/phospho-acceptor domain-containing protein [Desulfospira joergensenii]